MPMVDLPIIFSAPMIRGLLREVEEPGTGKTMTRRLAWKEKFTIDNGHAREPSPWQRVKPGDRLWVRENFHVQQVSSYRQDGDHLLVCVDYAADRHRKHFDFPAAGLPKILTKRGRGPSGQQTVVLPCIHMPRQISRLTLIVTATKIERLQDISDADARAEGMFPDQIEVEGQWIEAWFDGFSDRYASQDARQAFEGVWVKLHGAESWNANPEVVALTFRVHKQNIDAIPKEIAA